MLGRDFRDHVSELIHPRFEKCREQAKHDFSQRSADMAARGLLHSGAPLAAHHEACVKRVEARVAIVWEALQGVMSAMAVPYSHTLAADLKAELEYYVPMSLWELPESYSKVGSPNMPNLLAEFHQGLRENRARELTKAGAEIELHVESLRTKREATTQSATKEYEQKFKILLSPAQARKDFEEWQERLGPGNRPIAVLFVDVDSFKALNTRYTETKVDQTILPEAQRLISDFVRCRGEGYRQGGDEFIVILPNHDTSEAMAFAGKLRSSFEEHVFDVQGSSERLTVSIGVGLWPEHGSTYEEILEKANTAENVAKASRNTVKLTQLTQDQQRPLPRSGLSEPAQRLAVLLNMRSESGHEHDPLLEANEVLEALGLPEEDVAVGAEELEEKGWVTLSKDPGMGKAGFSAIWPAPILFFETDPVLKGWDAQTDANILAATLVAAGMDGVYLSEVDKTLAWGPRRLNPAASFLALNGYVKPSNTMSALPYVYTRLFVTPRTRRFATGA